MLLFVYHIHISMMNGSADELVCDLKNYRLFVIVKSEDLEEFPFLVGNKRRNNKDKLRVVQRTP